MAHPGIKTEEREALINLVRELKALASKLSGKEREILERVLLEFWLRTQCTGAGLVDSIGTEEALRRLIEWLEENGLSEDVGDDETDTGTTTGGTIG